MYQPIFISGIGTGIGKTIIAAILTEALEADYWKPVQAGFANGTDSLQVKELINNTTTVIHPEVYKFALAASPHIAAREENIKIDLNKIYEAYTRLSSFLPGAQAQKRHLIIEGAGGMMVPLNENEFVIDLVEKLNAKLILVSRNYLGSINHSLLTALACKQRNLDVAGWIFNDQYMHYEDEIAEWTGYPKIASIRFAPEINKDFIKQQALLLKDALQEIV